MFVAHTYWEPKSVHSAEHLCSVTFLQLLAMFYLMQPWVLLSILCQGHLANPCSPSCPPGPPGFFCQVALQQFYQVDFGHKCV